MGGLSGCITLAGIIIVLKWLGWAFYFDHWHNVAGTLFMVLCELLVIGGVFALVMKRCVSWPWQTKAMLRTAAGHKIFGYFMVFAVQVAIVTGITRRIGIGRQDDLKSALLITANLLIFFGTLIIGEFIHQRRLRTEVQFKSEEDFEYSMSRSDFTRNVKNGQKLVIVDNLVVDVSEFLSVHPGGRFVLHRVIGTDISKFFFGGYCMEGNLEGVSPGHNHSWYARMIVNELAVAAYESDIPVAKL